MVEMITVDMEEHLSGGEARCLTPSHSSPALREALKAGGSNAKEQAARKAILDVVKRETASADVCQKVVLQDLQALLTAETG